MHHISHLLKNQTVKRQRLVFAEGEDNRVIEAAVLCQQQGFSDSILIGNESTIRQNARDIGVELEQLTVIDPTESPQRQHYAEKLQHIRAKESLSTEAALKRLDDPLCFADMMLACDDADGSIAGAIYTTGDRVRSALQLIGIAPDYRIVSSFFLMLFPENHPVAPTEMLFSDCGLVIDPDADQLAEIASATVDSAAVLLNSEPAVAFLSFSTSGSVSHPVVEKVQTATAAFKQKHPTLKVDGEVQLDAALVPSVAEKKVKGSMVNGKANILIFPDLNAGNIGYKLAQRLGGAMAIGPILQGLKKPANDLSRGCSVDDVVNLAAITALQAAIKKPT